VKDRRYVDELTLDELEAVLRVRRRQERLRRLGDRGSSTIDPLRDESANPQDMPPVGMRDPGQQERFGSRYSAVIESGRSHPKRAIRWRWIGDRLLLLVEILALLGFALIVLQLTATVRGINEESRAALATPSPAPTPMVGVVVLPGGHTPPNAQGESEPAPIPAHLQRLVAEITPLPVPTPGPEQAQRIVIPSLGVDAPVIEGDDPESLKKGAGHHIGSANPGERGNCVISAHNDIYGEIFRYLPDMKVGDEIRVHTQTRMYRYVVEQTRIIEEDDVSVMASTHTPVLTLISCYPYKVDTHRIVVIAALKP